MCCHPPFYSSPDGGLLVFGKIDSGPNPDLKKYSCHEILKGPIDSPVFLGGHHIRMLYIAQNSFGHFFNRKDHINKACSNGAPGHSIEFGLIYILDDYHAAFFLDGPEPQGAVRSGPREDDTNGLLFLVFSKRAKKRVDREKRGLANSWLGRMKSSADEADFMSGGLT